MKEIIIDCAGITTPLGMHAAMAQAMAFPGWYGCNLDALYDCLTEVTEQTHLTLVHTQDLGLFMAGFRKVLQDASQANHRLHVTVLDTSL